MLAIDLWTEHGLVNGAIGTIKDIFWKEGQDTSTETPYSLMMEFDSYSGPTFNLDVSLYPQLHDKCTKS
jgi:ATP-dependent DNA helicase PIF1